MTGCYGMNPTLLPVSDMEHFNQPKPSIPRVKGGNGNIWATNAMSKIGFVLVKNLQKTE